MDNRLSTPAAWILTVASACLAVGCATPTAPTELDAATSSARSALEEALWLLDVEQGDERLLVMTNAGYARPDGHGTEPFADVAAEVTGCTVGKGSLRFLHTPSTTPLWFAAFRRDTRQLVFGRWDDGAFDRQVLEARPELLGDRDAWREANAGPVRGSLFQVLSFSHAWAQGADPLLLKCAEFHNHCCGGVTAGYLVGRYIQANLPLRARERYVFVTESPSCPMDALQVMFDTTAGKRGMYTTSADEETLSRHVVDDARPVTLVLRVDDLADTCDGALLGFAWDRTGQTSKLWNAAEVEELECVSVLRSFSGPASLARSFMETDEDPYGRIPAE